MSSIVVAVGRLENLFSLFKSSSICLYCILCVMDDSKLIELVREHPSIYNSKHPQYKDSNVRDNVWVEISGVMKIPVEECKNRWKNIRDTYMRRKRNHKLPTGSSTAKKLRKWHLEEHLVFLNLVEYERANLTNTVTQAESQEDGTQNTEIEQDASDTESRDAETRDIRNTENLSGISEQLAEVGALNKRPNKPKPESKISPENIVKLLKKNSDDRGKLLSTILAKQAEEQHPVDVFFQSMAISVKKMSPENQIRAKTGICQIVGQLELEEIRKTSSSSSSAQYDITSPTHIPHGSSASYHSPASLQDIRLMTNMSGLYFQ